MNGYTLVLPTWAELTTLYNKGLIQSNPIIYNGLWSADYVGIGNSGASQHVSFVPSNGGIYQADDYSPFTVLFQVSSSSNANTMGTSGKDILNGSAADDVITGNGGSDVIHTGAGNDTIVLNASNVTALSQPGAYVDGGTGTDTLVLDGSGITFNFAALQSKVVGIEKIDLTGSGNNMLQLSLADVIAVSDTHNLYVTGNAGDSVQVKGTSVTPTATSVSGVAYNDYNLDGIHHLYVQQAVTAVFVA